MAGRDDVVKALRLGANDYVTKPFDMPIVHARIHTQLALKRSAVELERANRDLARANRQMKSELEAAARLQRALLPSSMPDVPGVRLAWLHRPCEELAGDILNVFEIDAHHIGLYLLDVSGHGVRAALLSTALSRILAAQPDQPTLVRRRSADGELEPTPPLDVALELNRRFQFDERYEQYFTLFYGLLNTRSMELRYVCAGQPGPVYVPFDAPPRDLARPVVAIGWVPAPPYDEQRIRLRPGDRVFAYSDGLDEARSAAKEVFGSRRILGIVSESRGEPLEAALGAIAETVQRWAGRPFEDDVSALAIEAY
jgi:sigma-B regulation protein RsbU (phosphoserine phosphatase)